MYIFFCERKKEKKGQNWSENIIYEKISVNKKKKKKEEGGIVFTCTI